jgi:DNA primase
MPQGEDPDTLLRNAGPGAVQQAVETGISPLDYKMQALELRKSQMAVEEFWSRAVELLTEAPTEMELNRHLQRLAGQYPGISDVRRAEEAIRREVVKVKRAINQNAAKDQKTPVRLQAKQLKGELSSAEVIVFLAFLSEEFRIQGWMFSRKRDLFVSGVGMEISDAISAAFPGGAPEGGPALWLHRIENEELRQTMADLLQDFRAENFTEARFADTVEVLVKELHDRQLAESRRSNLDTAKRQEILMKLRQRKPDTLKKQQSDDSPFD